MRCDGSVNHPPQILRGWFLMFKLCYEFLKNEGQCGKGRCSPVYSYRQITIQAVAWKNLTKKSDYV